MIFEMNNVFPLLKDHYEDNFSLFSLDFHWTRYCTTSHTSLDPSKQQRQGLVPEFDFGSETTTRKTSKDTTLVELADLHRNNSPDQQNVPIKKKRLFLLPISTFSVSRTISRFDAGLLTKGGWKQVTPSVLLLYLKYSFLLYNHCPINRLL